MINHPFKEGERVHFAHESDLMAGLRHGYLEQMLFGDQGILNRVIRYQPESETYLWYEAYLGVVPQAIKKRTYSSLEELLGEVDVHAYYWHPLFPRGYERQQQTQRIEQYLGDGEAPIGYNTFLKGIYPTSGQ